MALKIKRKFIEDAAVDGLKLKLTSGQAVKLVKSDGSTEVRLIELDESSNKIKLGGATAALLSDVTTEAGLREAGDAAISGQIQTLVGSEADARADGDEVLSDRIDALEGPTGSIAEAVEAEAVIRQGADEALDGRLDILEGADSVAGSVAKALKDAKDYTDGEVADEAEARQGADEALDARLDVIEGADSVAGSVAKALKDAKDYTDGEIADEATARQNADDDIIDRLDILEGADSIEGSVAKALKDAKDYVNDVVGISSEAVAAFASLSAQMVDGDAATGIINSLGSLDERLDTLQGANTVEGSVAKALKDAKDYTDGEIADEAEARQGADEALDARLDILEGANTVAGSVAKALKDAKDYVNDVVGISSEAVAAFASLSAQMVDGDAATGIITALGSVDQRLDVIEGANTVEGSVAKALKDAKDYTDGEVADEATARQNADSDLQSELDATQTGAGLGADGSYSAPVGSNYLGSAVSLKGADSALDSAIKGIQDQIDSISGGGSGSLGSLSGELDATQTGAGLGADGSYSAPVGSNYLGSAVSLKDADSKLDAAIKAEQDRAEGEEGNLSDRLDVIEGADSVAGSVAKALKDAKDYTDGEIADEAEARQGADEALDARLDILEGANTVAGSVAKALKDAKDYVNDVVGISSEAVAAFASLSAQMVDGDAATGIITALGSVDQRLDVIEGANTVEGSVAKALKDAKDYTDGEVADEATARQNADSDLSGRLDSLEANVHKKQKFVMGESIPAYVDLDFIAMDSSVVASVGRLMIHEGVGEDFTMSVVGGVSRLTFVGNLTSSSAEQLAEGDILYVKYVKA